MITTENQSPATSKGNLTKTFPQLLAVKENVPGKFQNASLNDFLNEGNTKILQAAIDFANNPSGILTILGNIGSGKTHLAVAIQRNAAPVKISDKRKSEVKSSLDLRLEHWNERLSAAKSHGEETVKIEAEIEITKQYLNSNAWQYRQSLTIYVSVVKLLFELNNSLATKGVSKLEYFNDLLRHDLIVLDDFGAEKISEASRQNLFYLIDFCYAYNKALIITTNNTLEEINRIEPRIASRLAEGKIISLNHPDRRLKPRQQQ